MPSEEPVTNTIFSLMPNMFIVAKFLGFAVREARKQFF